MVSNTSELLPEPETPVNTVSRRFGISTLTSFRLFSRAPCTRMTSCESVIPGLRLVEVARRLAAPAQLRELDQVAAAVVEHGHRAPGRLRGRRSELAAVRFDALRVGLDVGRVEIRRWQVLLEHG